MDPGRPIVGRRERARVLAAVDFLVIFDEPAPLELIVGTRPDVLVKGGDSEVETVVGIEQVQSRGGQGKIVPMVDGDSTPG
jgi:bifunctional ADP-heptose synthase (sugar kinase/adenylyltransferase)